MSERKPTPEQLLQQVESDERFQSRGRLKIFLGYASGVGKSFRMIDEGRRRRERGQDVVVGAIQPNLAADVQHATFCAGGNPVEGNRGRSGDGRRPALGP